jgi:hypothetical protein
VHFLNRLNKVTDLKNSTFAPLWSLVQSWVGVSSADPLSIHDQFLPFVYSAGGSRARHFFMQLLWLYCIWVVWHQRNKRIFKAKESSVIQMVEEFKVHLLWWMKTYNVNFGLNFHMWWTSLVTSMGID